MSCSVSLVFSNSVASCIVASICLKRQISLISAVSFSPSSASSIIPQWSLLGRTVYLTKIRLIADGNCVDPGFGFEESVTVFTFDALLGTKKVC